MFSNFIWDGRQPQIINVFLQSPIKLGGMAMPNPLNYYWASNIQKVITHVQSNPLEHAP